MGGGGGLRGGSQPMSTRYNCTQAKVNCGDLTPYLTYGCLAKGEMHIISLLSYTDPDPNPDPRVFGPDPASDPDPSIIKQK